MMNSDERKITCCFTGHRADKLPWVNDERSPMCLALRTAIYDAVDAVYASGWRRFICGMANGCDTYFGEAVVALREEHPDIILEAAIPYEGQERAWKAEQRLRYARLAESCDRVTVLSPFYHRGCMMERNRYMVDRSSVLIAVYGGGSGGTKNTLEYAASQGLSIIRLPTEIFS